jgi:hypothetical protein
MAARGDYSYISPQEAFWAQLGRRIEHPGYNARGGTPELFQSLQLADSQALAYRFCIVPPGGASTEIEKLTASYITPAPLKPYQGNLYGPGAGTWFTDNFAYGPAPFATFRQLRPLTVARNPVANSRASFSVTPTTTPPTLPAGRPGFRGAWISGQQYNFGDWVTDTPGYSYLCIRPHSSATPNSRPTTFVGGRPAALGLYWEKVPWGDQPVKANINTASFGELWHAFLDVMVDPTGDATWFAPYNTVVPTGPAGGGPGMRMFRSSMRDGKTPPLELNAWQMMQLRSAIAAVNAMDLRDSDSDVTSRDIVLTRSPIDSTIILEATVFGTERNPYITEVMVDTGTPGFIGIELYNPSPIPVDLTGWRLGSIDRSGTAVLPRLITDLLGGADLGTVVAGATGSPAIAPGDYIVLTDGAAPTMQVKITTNGKIPVPVPGMAQLTTGFNHEIVVLRTRNASGVPSQATSMPGDAHDEVSGINLGDLVPVDQIDLTGIQPGSIAGAQQIAYRRPSLAGAAPSTAWHFSNSGGWTRTPLAGFFRQVGMRILPGDEGNLGAGDTTIGVAPISNAGTFSTRPVQIANVDTAGPNKTYQQLSGTAASGYPLTGPPNHFPFGGFARNGDILQVPFIGAYTIREPGAARDTAVIEMNSLPMDAGLADDEDATNDGNPATPDTGVVTELREQLGRFCPVGNPQAGVGLRGDYEPLPFPPPKTTAAVYDAARARYRYQWAMDLFDHLTVESPSDDLMPDVDREIGDPRIAPTPPPKYPGTPPALVANEVQTVANDKDGPPMDTGLANSPAGSSEGKVPVEGLININTASPKVLSALPMVLDPATGAVDTNLNAALAQAIVDYRDGNAATTTDPNGPFRTIYDLYKVPLFYQRQLDVLTAGDPDDLAGDISPLGTGATGSDGVRFDFEERFLLLNRISNMITTRSDSYTVYLLVQGWQDAGTATPTLRTQRRLAFIVDRSRITPNSPQLSPIPVPNN